ncbi:MAG: hypothetical protein MRJ92_03240 [Nitrospira sp.]|nr:hypothetical protein [Nitrospira sp.]
MDSFILGGDVPPGPLQYSTQMVAGQSGPAGANTYRQASPTLSIRPLLAEAFGLTDSCHPYVYLSDGGHFENLGLYEMVRQRVSSSLSWMPVAIPPRL